MPRNRQAFALAVMLCVIGSIDGRSQRQPTPGEAKSSFEWRASLDRGTGIASSRERSFRGKRSVVVDAAAGSPTKGETVDIVGEIFSDYPKFL